MASTTVSVERFGILEDAESGERRSVRRFTLDGHRGVVAQVLTYGGAVSSLTLPDRRGYIDDIALGFDSLEEYVEHSSLSLSGVMGRVSGRISGATFRVGDGIHYVTESEGRHHRDGGDAAFHKVLWEASECRDGVRLSHVSAAGAAGFPGAVLAEVCYRLPPDSVLPELHVEFSAVCTAPTPVDMSLALPLNLAGHDGGEEDINKHKLLLCADRYLAMTPNLVPTGARFHVGGTCYDFRRRVQLGLAMPRTAIGGFDHVYCADLLPSDGLRLNARLEHPDTGRAVEIRSDQSAVRLYTCRDLPEPWSTEPEELESPETRQEPAPEGSFYKPDRLSAEELFPDYVDLYAGSSEGGGDAPDNVLECEEEPQPKPTSASSEDVDPLEVCQGSAVTLPGLPGKGGASYYRAGAVLLTPQGYPDAVNRKNFPSCILMPGETYQRTVVYRFFTGAEGICKCPEPF